MEQRIIDSANKYKELALMLKDFTLEQAIDDTLPQEVQAALLKLYYAKTLEIQLEKCETFLNEDTDGETVNAVADAAEVIDGAADAAFFVVEGYTAENKAFEKMIDNISVDSGVKGVTGHLLKLYKCEDIISTAYRCAAKTPLFCYRGSRHGLEMDIDTAAAPEDFIIQQLGIDIYKLFEIRQHLLDEIGKMIERKSKWNGFLHNR
ncbi:MAG: hypothetical protein ACOX8Q_06805 [Christensenellales bacterium]|jgi:hypothetical protein